jgi:hypothetical protein
MRNGILILAFGLLSLALYAALVFDDRIDNPTGDYIIKFLWISQLLFFVYLGILLIARRSDTLARNKRLFVIIVAVAVVIRLMVAIGAGEAAVLSDDVYRYIFEGKMVASDYNPFVISPMEMAGSGIADTVIYPHINHPNLPTIYPPLSQYVFTASYLIGGDSLVGFKIVSVIFELATLLVLLLFVRKSGLPEWTYFIYLLSPLVIIEFLYSNHLDILAMPFFVGSLYFISQRQATASGITLALAALVKLFAFFFIPIFFFYLRGKERVWFLLAFVVAFVVVYSPFLLTAGPEAFGSLWKYLGTWQFNGSIHVLFKAIVGEQAARVIVGAMFGLAVAGLALYRRGDMNPIVRTFWAFGFYIILTPSLFSWYLVWILPLLMVTRNMAFLVLSGTIFLSYHVLIGYYTHGAWSEYWWLRVAEYIPFYGLLIYQLIKNKPGLARVTA